MGTVVTLSAERISRLLDTALDMASCSEPSLRTCVKDSLAPILAAVDSEAQDWSAPLTLPASVPTAAANEVFARVETILQQAVADARIPLLALVIRLQIELCHLRAPHIRAVDPASPGA